MTTTPEQSTDPTVWCAQTTTPSGMPDVIARCQLPADHDDRHDDSGYRWPEIDRTETPPAPCPWKLRVGGTVYDCVRPDLGHVQHRSANGGMWGDGTQGAFSMDDWAPAAEPCPWRFSVQGLEDDPDICSHTLGHPTAHHDLRPGRPSASWISSDQRAYTEEPEPSIDADPTQILTTLPDAETDAAIEAADDAEALRTGGTFAGKYLPETPVKLTVCPAVSGQFQLDCALQPEHDGEHESAGGFRWPGYDADRLFEPCPSRRDDYPRDPQECARPAGHHGVHATGDGGRWWDGNPGVYRTDDVERLLDDPVTVVGLDQDAATPALVLMADIPLYRRARQFVRLAGNSPETAYPIVPRPARDQLIATLRYAIEMLESQG